MAQCSGPWGARRVVGRQWPPSLGLGGESLLPSASFALLQYQSRGLVKAPGKSSFTMFVDLGIYQSSGGSGDTVPITGEGQRREGTSAGTSGKAPAAPGRDKDLCPPPKPGPLPASPILKSRALPFSADAQRWSSTRGLCASGPPSAGLVLAQRSQFSAP